MNAGNKKGKNGAPINVADMKVAYDQNGKVMKLAHYDIDKMVDNQNKPLEVLQCTLTNTIKRESSEAMMKLQAIKDKKLKKNSAIQEMQ